MALHFQTPTFDEAPARMFLENFDSPKVLHEWMQQHTQWLPIHDRVMSEFRSPLIALAWRGYRPGLVAEKDFPLAIYGVTIITPVEAQDMIYQKKKESFINQPGLN